MRLAWPAVWVIAITAAAAQGQTVCATCHAGIAQSYRGTGMARSFAVPGPGNRIEDYTNHTHHHAASDTSFEMIEREGKYFQRQYQIGFEGKQVNVVESVIDFIIGSGNHARTYLHRTPTNQLTELPLGWYAEKGGYWDMNPGYDRPDHAGLARAIPYEC